MAVIVAALLVLAAAATALAQGPCTHETFDLDTGVGLKYTNLSKIAYAHAILP